MECDQIEYLLITAFTSRFKDFKNDRNVILKGKCQKLFFLLTFNFFFLGEGVNLSVSGFNLKNSHRNSKILVHAAL